MPDEGFRQARELLSFGGVHFSFLGKQLVLRETAPGRGLEPQKTEMHRIGGGCYCFFGRQL
jgi:hypothetical protein